MKPSLAALLFVMIALAVIIPTRTSFTFWSLWGTALVLARCPRLVWLLPLAIILVGEEADGIY